MNDPIKVEGGVGRIKIPSESMTLGSRFFLLLSFPSFRSPIFFPLLFFFQTYLSCYLTFPFFVLFHRIYFLAAGWLLFEKLDWVCSELYLPLPTFCK